MDAYSSMLATIRRPESIERFAALYGHREGELSRQLTRYSRLVKLHEDLYHADRSLYMISAPGRTEITGNHTDHNNGCVLAAAITLDTVAAVTPRYDMKVRIHSEGFPSIELELDDLSVHEDEKSTSAALVRGVAAKMAELGYKVGGFDAAITTDVASGSGLSSSAAYEVLICAILDALYNGFTDSGINNAAHIGGLVLGFLLGMLLYRGGQSIRGHRQPESEDVWYDLS